MTDLASLISSSLYHRSLSWQTVCLGSLSCCTMKVWPMRLKDLPDKMCQYTSEFIQLLLPSSMKTLSQLPETAAHAKAMPSPSFTDEFELFGFLLSPHFGLSVDFGLICQENWFRTLLVCLYFLGNSNQAFGFFADGNCSY